MQSTLSRPDSPNPEQDTLLHALNPSGAEATDEMPTAKRVGDDRGMIDTIGLGLVYVCRTPFNHFELMVREVLGHLYCLRSCWCWLGALLYVECLLQEDVLMSRNTDGSHFTLYSRAYLSLP